MTYCVGIKVNEGMVFASDRRTNAGLDNFNSYSKMYVHKGIDRNIIILTSGNLATSQAVFNSITKDLEKIEQNCQSTISSRGIIFKVYSADKKAAEEKKWPLDIIPRIILKSQWLKVR